MAAPGGTAKRSARGARPPSIPRAERRAGTREQIRAAAWELFSTIGYDATTTHAIARRAGVAAGTVFVHASDKADLLFLVMHDRLADAVEQRFATMPSGALIDRLMHVFSGVFAKYGEHPDVGAAFVRALPGAKGPNAQRVWTMTFGFLHRLSLLIGEAQATGEVSREIDALLAAQNVFALYFAALVAWLNGHSTLEAALVPLLRDSLALQIRGLRP
jgi:AcrR family transcriptional regulator